MDSILNTVKMALGVEADYTGFDTNILLDINSAISNLNQLGIGPVNGFVVKSDRENWKDLLGDSILLESSKSYILDKVRLSFDPPSNSYLVDAIEKQIRELEWRLMVQVDPPYNLFMEEVLLTKSIFYDLMEDI